MAKKAPKQNTRDEAFLEALGRHPELRQRMESILGLADSPEHQHLSADKVEEMLIEEVRKLGAETMQQWAQGVESSIAQEMQQKKPRPFNSKKNA